MSKDQILNQQVQSNNDGPDISEAIKALGMSDTHDAVSKDLSLDPSDGELPSIKDVEEEILKSSAALVDEETASEYENNKQPDFSDKQVEFNEEGEVIVKSKKDKGDKSEPKSEEQEGGFEIDLKATYKIPVDGKIIELKGSELQSKASGEVAIEKRLTQLDLDRKTLDNERKQWYNERDSLLKDVEEVGNQAKNDNWEGAFEALGKIGGIPGFLIKEKMISALLPEIQRRSELSNEELRFEYLKAQNDHLTKITESKTKRNAEEQALKELQNKVNTIRETHKIEESEWNEAFAKLDAELPPNQDLTANTVVEHILAKRESAQIESKANKALSIIDEPTQEAKDYMLDIIKKHPEFTDEQLMDIVKQALSSIQKDDVKQDLQEKVKQTKSSSAVLSNEINEEAIMAILEGDY